MTNRRTRENKRKKALTKASGEDGASQSRDQVRADGEDSPIMPGVEEITGTEDDKGGVASTHLRPTPGFEPTEPDHQVLKGDNWSAHVAYEDYINSGVYNLRAAVYSEAAKLKIMPLMLRVYSGEIRTSKVGMYDITSYPKLLTPHVPDTRRDDFLSGVYGDGWIKYSSDSGYHADTLNNALILPGKGVISNLNGHYSIPDSHAVMDKDAAAMLGIQQGRLFRYTGGLYCSRRLLTGFLSRLAATYGVLVSEVSDTSEVRSPFLSIPVLEIEHNDSKFTSPLVGFLPGVTFNACALSLMNAVSQEDKDWSVITRNVVSAFSSFDTKPGFSPLLDYSMSSDDAVIANAAFQDFHPVRSPLANKVGTRLLAPALVPSFVSKLVLSMYTTSHIVLPSLSWEKQAQVGQHSAEISLSLMTVMFINLFGTNLIGPMPEVIVEGAVNDLWSSFGLGPKEDSPGAYNALRAAVYKAKSPDVANDVFPTDFSDVLRALGARSPSTPITGCDLADEEECIREITSRASELLTALEGLPNALPGKVFVATSRQVLISMVRRCIDAIPAMVKTIRFEASHAYDLMVDPRVLRRYEMTADPGVSSSIHVNSKAIEITTSEIASFVYLVTAKGKNYDTTASRLKEKRLKFVESPSAIGLSWVEACVIHNDERLAVAEIGRILGPNPTQELLRAYDDYCSDSIRAITHPFKILVAGYLSGFRIPIKLEAQYRDGEMDDLKDPRTADFLLTSAPIRLTKLTRIRMPASFEWRNFSLYCLTYSSDGADVNVGEMKVGDFEESLTDILVMQELNSPVTIQNQYGKVRPEFRVMQTTSKEAVIRELISLSKGRKYDVSLSKSYVWAGAQRKRIVDRGGDHFTSYFVIAPNLGVGAPESILSYVYDREVLNSNVLVGKCPDEILAKLKVSSYNVPNQIANFTPFTNNPRNLQLVNL